MPILTCPSSSTTPPSRHSPLKPAIHATPCGRPAWQLLPVHPRSICKLSGLLTELPVERRSTPERAVAALRPTVEKLLAWFGPRRIVWGSDWPVLTLAASFGGWVKVTELLLDGLSASERTQILAGAAQRFYGLEGGRA
ncbi:amidohydrolase family protein [Aminobacter sp. UC22_36]|uniref:amidohydrolase family protein n=1 Tax=Aminobacter sp. UC22_36 TaxID=3374549 RepID=UPI003757C901